MSLSSREILSKAPVVPVLVIEDANDAVPLAKALVAGGLPVLEITLRSDAAEESIKRIIAEVPDAIAGAGTVINAKQMERMAEIGCAFAVSPGHSEGLLKAAHETGCPLLPGAGTPSEIMNLLDHGYDVMKFFPAEQQGGVSMLKALSGRCRKCSSARPVGFHFPIWRIIWLCQTSSRWVVRGLRPRMQSRPATGARLPDLPRKQPTRSRNCAADCCDQAAGRLDVERDPDHRVPFLFGASMARYCRCARRCF